MICATCGKEHPLEEMELTFLRPDDAAALSAADKERLLRENKDLCIIAGERFFVRGVLPLPVASRDTSYGIGLWVEVTRVTFDRIYHVWEDDDQAGEPPFDAQIANEIPVAAGSLGPEAELRLTGPSTRPHVYLKPGSHPLYLEQAHGIDAHRIGEYTAVFAPTTPA